MWYSGIVVYVYYNIIRSVYKWFLRLLTGHCELLRITSSEHVQPHRTSSIEYSLKHSKSHLLRSIVDDGEIANLNETVRKIIKLKHIKDNEQSMFSRHLGMSISQINGYRQLFAEVEDIRKTAYSCAIAEHELLLQQLWNALQPDFPLQSRVSHQWGDIGFQGDDPATDFRGMGLLGLKNLVFFSTRFTDLARSLLSQSTHPQYGYSFAIVGINLTSMAYQLLRNGYLKTHFYCVVPGPPQLQDFHLVYVHLFYEFNHFWIDSKPANIMEFNTIREKFNQMVIEQLQSKLQPLQFQFNRQV